MARIALLAWVLSFGVVLGVRAAEPGALVFTPQATVPTMLKDDWRSSAFSRDGALLLAIDGEGSVIVHVPTGRALRAVALVAGETLIWVRAVGDEAWIGFTSRGRFVEVDARTGGLRPIADFHHVPARDAVRPPAATFEMTAAGVLVGVVSLPGGDHASAPGGPSWTGRAFVRLDPRTGSAQVQALGSAATQDLDEQLTLNRATGAVALFDPTSSGEFAIWEPSAAPGTLFRRACAVEADDDRVVDVIAYGDGFLAIHASGRAKRVSSTACTAPEPTPAGPCEFDLKIGDAPLLSALPDGAADRLVMVDQALTAVPVTLAEAGCQVRRGRPIDLAPHDALWRWQDTLKAPHGALRRADVVLSAPLPDGQGRAFVVSGALVQAKDDAGVRRLADLVGRPTGAWELESQGGVIATTLPLSPIRLFDVRNRQARDLVYDVITPISEGWVFNRPFGLASDLSAVLLVDWRGHARYETAAAVAERPLPPAQQLPVDQVVGVCSSPDGAWAWVATLGGEIVAFRREARDKPLRELGRIRTPRKADSYFKAACDRSGSAVFAATLTDDLVVLRADVAGVKLIQRLHVKGAQDLRQRPPLSPDGRLLAVGAQLFARNDIAAPFRSAGAVPGANAVVFDDRGSWLLAVGEATAIRSVGRDPSGRVTLGAPGPNLGVAQGGAFLPGGLAVLFRDANGLDVVDATQGAALGSLALGADQRWLFVDRQSRFDTNALDQGAPGHWLAPEDPLRPLPAEIFMRDYFEPKLMERTAVCRVAEASQPGACHDAFGEVRSLADLNRAQPGVAIRAVTPLPGGAVRVALETSPGVALGGAGVQYRSEAYDLRLFRDGQLVARWPHRTDDGPVGLAAWRELWRSTGRYEAVVQLPTGARAEPVAFTAYAYNEDRVKSATVQLDYTPASPTPKRPGKAYVIVIGVNGYQAPERALSFAVRDAEAMATALSGLQGYDLTIVRLTSEVDPATWRATRANVREALARLAGAAPTPGLLADVAGADQLRRATPDDLVIVTFSGHGYADPMGGFYLLTSDSGRDAQITAASLPAFLSSEQLSEWLRPVDAGQLALIIDACHSAASVAQPGFKPGPMGDRGLGQLAYDKAMRVLAASQADSVALESANLRQGLLTYALVQEGLTRTPAGRLKADENEDGRLTLVEWLRYGEQRTPGLYEDIRTGRLKAVDADPKTLESKDPIVSAETIAAQAQIPALFDFTRLRPDQEPSLGAPTVTAGRPSNAAGEAP